MNETKDLSLFSKSSAGVLETAFLGVGLWPLAKHVAMEFKKPWHNLRVRNL